MRAVIFDMNGVIINDERFHQQSWRVLIDRYPDKFKLPTEEEFKHNVFGRSERATLQYLLGLDVSQAELESFSEERVAIVKELFNPPVIADGLGELMIKFKRQNLPIGVATGSRPNYADHILDRLDIRQHIGCMVTADDIKKSKPDPEIYLKTAELLGVPPKECLVFEDTISGIRAGQAAGMHVIAIASTHRADELTLADEVVRSFRQVKLMEGGQIHIEAEQLNGQRERL
jgi:beta-phosphoglucomutase-like phosphatase (HAD superfamily)